MSTLDLRPEWLELIRRLITLYLPEAEVIAYGSRLNGTAHGGSDLDLVARNPHDPLLPFRDLCRLREAFSESNLPILVDIQDWARIPDSFREEIEQTGVIVFPLQVNS